MRHANVLTATAAITLVAAGGVAPAAAEAPRALTAQAYPGNTIKVAVDEPLVAGTIARVKLSGHAQWKDPNDIFLSDYGLYLYVQDAEADPACEPWYGQQLQKAINVRVNATTANSGFAMDGEQAVKRDPATLGLDWSTDSAPFTIRPGVRKVLLCAYQRYVIDDVASYQLPAKVQQPRCRPVRSSVRRGSKLRLRCNVSGRATVRFRGDRTRTLGTRLSSANGNGTVSTRSLRPGRYRVTVRAGDQQLGRSFTVRVR
jgi:hypothetical protein